jgi:hypothetical protein
MCSLVLMALVMLPTPAVEAIEETSTIVHLPGQGAVRGVQLPGSRYWYLLRWNSLGQLHWNY